MCMVAERTSSSAFSEAMASSRPGTPRQPSLAEEIEEVEKAEKVTAALQAVGTRHDTHDIKQKPQMDKQKSVTKTPTKVSIKSSTPSPDKVIDGVAWDLEDHEDQFQEEQEMSP